MSQREDEQEIETRLRAAFMARSEQVTHQSLRPGVVPGTRAAQEQAAEQAAADARQKQQRYGQKSGPASRPRFAWNLSWRGLLVPAMVTAALVIGVGVGVVLPRGDSGSPTAGSGASVGRTPVSVAPSATGSSSATSAASTPIPGSAAGTESFGGFVFQSAGWTLTKVDDVTACVLPPKHAVVVAAKLPCGVDALMIKADVTASAWPLNSVDDKYGWWPVRGASARDIACPAPARSAGPASGATPSPASTALAAPTSTSSNAQRTTLKDSAVFRSEPDFALDGTATAAYQEWSATCTDGTGLRPLLWQLPGGKTVVTAISASPDHDGVLLAIVKSMHHSVP